MGYQCLSDALCAGMRVKYCDKNHCRHDKLLNTSYAPTFSVSIFENFLLTLEKYIESNSHFVLIFIALLIWKKTTRCFYLKIPSSGF